MKATASRFRILMGFALFTGWVMFQPAHAEDTHADHDDHAGHDHAAHDEGETDKGPEDHADDEHVGDDHNASDVREGHEHDGHEQVALAGPNGGRMIRDVEPSLEFLVRSDRRIELRAFDAEQNAVAFGEQWIQVIGGSRSTPTRMLFTLSEGVLVSDVPLPQGDSIPVVLRVRKSPAAEVQTIKFNVNLTDCPSCKFKEYACNCAH